MLPIRYSPPPALPTAPTQQPQEDRREYGSRILRAILSDPTPAPIGPILAGYTDDQLDAAERAAYYAVTARDIDPRAVDTLAQVRRTITQTQQIRQQLDIDARAALAQQLETPTQPAQPPAGAADDTHGGSRVPRPVPPPTRPPGGSYAIPDATPRPTTRPAAPAAPAAVYDFNF